MQNSVEDLGYIKCYIMSSPITNKSPSNSIKYNCQKIYSASRRPETLLQIREKSTFLEVIGNLIMSTFFKDFSNDRKKTDSSNDRKKTDSVVHFTSRSLTNILKYRDHK